MLYDLTGSVSFQCSPEFRLSIIIILVVKLNLCLTSKDEIIIREFLLVKYLTSLNIGYCV